MTQNYINHIAFVLDASGSMSNLRNDLIRVADEQVKQLATQSKQLDQETRVTAYSFDDRVSCAHYDKDVLRLPSIADFYRIGGQTALIDATLQAISDLEKSATLYGDHSFLLFVLTDGAENASRNHPSVLRQKLASLPVEWTVAILVPNSMGKHYAQGFGFAPGNIAIWDATSARGLEESMVAVAAATTNYMVNRTTGTRGTQNLFGGSNQVNSATVAQMNLQPLDRARYMLHPIPNIPDKTQVQPYVNSLGKPFRLGSVFYELMKPEKIQAGKTLAVLEKGTDKLYVGPQVRQMLNLPDLEVRVKPDMNKNFKIFVQSNSTNRHLVPHTTLLIMEP